MNKLVFASAILALSALTTLSQERVVDLPIESRVPDSARFQIVHPIRDNNQSMPLFRLDKYTGQVFRLATCPKDAKIGSEKCWKEMMIVDLPRPSAAVGQPRFQIFVGGQPQLILLIQVDTGMTWQYGIDEPDKWYPFLDTVFLP